MKINLKFINVFKKILLIGSEYLFKVISFVFVSQVWGDKAIVSFFNNSYSKEP